MAFVGTASASRKLLHGAGGAIVRVVAADGDAVGMSFGLGGLWQLIVGLFGSAVHLLVLPFEALWRLLQTAVASAGNELVTALEAFWRWVKTTASVALPFVLLIALVVSLVALVWYCWPLLFTAAALMGNALMWAGVGIAKALVLIAMGVGLALSYCCQCCAFTTMNAPGAAGFLISRAAFVANPALYFQILRSAGSVVAAAIFSTTTVASALAAPVAALFRT